MSSQPQSVDEQSVDEQSADEQSVDDQSVDERSADEQTTDGEMVTSEGGDAASSGRGSRAERLEAEGDVAADYLEELLDIVDLDGDIEIGVDGDRAVVSLVGEGLDHLAGRDGSVLDALQELVRLSVHRETGERSRLMLDVGEFRAQRRAALEALAAEQIAQVRASGAAASLDPMSAFERKVVHDAVAAAGLVSESEGAEPRRYVVILPA